MLQDAEEHGQGCAIHPSAGNLHRSLRMGGEGSWL